MHVILRSKTLSKSSISLLCRCFGWLAICIAVFSGDSHAETYAYVPNSGLDTVSVIRTSDNVLVETISVGKAPTGVAVSPDGYYAYVTNKEDNTLSVISTSENAVMATVAVGTEPMGVSAGFDGLYVYVANAGDDTVSVILIGDDDNYTVSATISVGDTPHGVAVDPVDGDVYVANKGDDTVSVIQMDDETFTIGVGGGPVGIAVDSEGEYAYVTNHSDDTVSIIDIEDDDNSVISTISVGAAPWGLSIGNSGEQVYVANNLDDTVSIIDTGDREVTATLVVGDSPLGVAAPKNGDFAYVINGWDDSISKINYSGEVLSTVELEENSEPVGLGAFIGGVPPEAPSDLEVSADSDEDLYLSWDDHSYDELGFKIERREYDDEDSVFTQIATVGSNETSYTDSGLEASTTYEYRVRAFNESADSEYSDEASAQTEEEGSSTSVSCFIKTADTGNGFFVAIAFLAILLLFQEIWARIHRKYRFFSSREQ